MRAAGKRNGRPLHGAVVTEGQNLGRVTSSAKRIDAATIVTAADWSILARNGRVYCLERVAQQGGTREVQRKF